MINLRTIEDVEDAIALYVSRLSDLKVDVRRERESLDDYYKRVGFETGDSNILSIRRASLDLSRILADLRRPAP